MKKISFLLTVCFALIACKKTDISFTYTPETPRAGETVRFANHSSSGQDWEWTFGDGSTSSLKSPSHVYKQPGTYRVVLKVDKKNSWTATKQITVFDTVPTFVCADSTFYIYRDYTFTANLYNPYNYEVEYQWFLPSDRADEEPCFRVAADEDWKSSTLRLYFTRPGEVPIGLRVILNGDTTDIEKTLAVADRATNSVLMRTTLTDYRQRIFGERAEPVREDRSEQGRTLLDYEQDTVQTYNGTVFRLSELKTVFAGLEGFHIANRKIYYRMNGLWVANIDGAYPVQIDAETCTAMTLDTQDNRIYWANSQGVWYMPFVGSDNNRFVTVPTRLNTLVPVVKIAADYEKK